MANPVGNAGTGILVLDEHAVDYAAELRRRRPELDPTVAVDSAQASAWDQPIWLAQPDLALDALESGARPPRWLQSTWAGVAPIVDTARRHQFELTGLAGIFGPLIAEYVFTYVLGQVRLESRYREAQRRRHWSERWPGTLRDARMTVIGTGSIGAHIAVTAKHFRMTTTGVSASGRARPGFDRTVPVTRLLDALDGADFVVACLPETPATRGLLGSAEIAAMGASTMFVNVGRGSCVDHDALIVALDAGALGAAVLDVFPQEPLAPESPIWDARNTTVTPHIAGVTYARDVIDCFLANLERFDAGQPLQRRIDPRRGY